MRYVRLSSLLGLWQFWKKLENSFVNSIRLSQFRSNYFISASRQVCHFGKNGVTLPATE